MGRLNYFLLPSVFICLGIESVYAFFLSYQPIYILRALLESIVAVALWRARQTFKVDKQFSTQLIVVAHIILPALLSSVEKSSNSAYFLIPVAVGLLTSVCALLDIGPSFGILPADRGLVKNGLYGFVRHPIYLGYLISMIGWCCFSPSFANFSILMLYVPLTILRIQREEFLLSEMSQYKSYSASVRYRIIPGVY